ncbi:hypothetical protein CYMTET_51871 [Cymbomonas tetramitiformis]|uniref:Uncharacterized protein n=1 Tax=Cymbomonas tetramitiformis TaxID=36881 RepID=A0AAE0ERX1_9CHLO|nr:hypothetical protein CYMTET_51871 [Cymbomonas tetramitiformis]
MADLEMVGGGEGNGGAWLGSEMGTLLVAACWSGLLRWWANPLVTELATEMVIGLVTGSVVESLIQKETE